MEMRLGDKIKKIRDLKGFKQEDIAAKLNITAQAYSKIERNETKMDIERLTQIASILGVSIEDIEDFDDKNMFVNNLKECENSQVINYIVNNYSDTEKMFPILEKVITQQKELLDQQKDLLDQQKEEIQYLRTQLAKALETKK